MFDPEKVERHQGFLAMQHDRTGDEMWVTTDDYDQLLELYRKAEEALLDAKLHEDSTAL